MGMQMPRGRMPKEKPSYATVAIWIVLILAGALAFFKFVPAEALFQGF